MIRQSPIAYMGSKYKLLDRLIPLFPEKNVFIDLFAGGGSVYMNVAERYHTVIANDILTDIIEIHSMLGDHAFMQRVKALSVPTKSSQELYLALRESYNVTPNGEKLFALILSCNSNMMRFNTEFKFNQTWGKRCYNDSTHRKWQHYLKHTYDNVRFSNVHFSKLELPDKCFVYLDPPYSNTEAGYNAFWSHDDEATLIAYVSSLHKDGIAFGISGVINDKPNCVFDTISSLDGVAVHYFEDLYQKISKKEKTNQEYYITNATPRIPQSTLF